MAKDKAKNKNHGCSINGAAFFMLPVPRERLSFAGIDASLRGASLSPPCSHEPGLLYPARPLSAEGIL